MRAFDKRDIIAEELNLEPLPVNPDEDRALRAEYRRSKIISQGLHRGVFDEDGNLWIPVASAEEARNFFKRSSQHGEQSSDNFADALGGENIFVEVKDKESTSSLPSPKKIPKVIFLTLSGG